MATREDVLDAIHRIEKAGGATDATRAAQAALTMPLPASGYEQVLSRLRSAEPARAEPAPLQDGRAAQAMKNAEAALAQQLSSTAEFDRQIIEALRQAHQTTQEGRRRIADLEMEIVGAAHAWDLSTASGAREFQRFLIGKLGEIIRVVEDTNDDDASKRALATALTALYAAQPGRGEPEPAGPKGDGDDDPVPSPPVSGVADDAADEAYPDPLLDDEPPAPEQATFQRPPEAPAMPSVPGLGADGPGFGALPAGLPAAFPPAGLPAGPTPADTADDQDYPLEDPAPADDIAPDEAEGAGSTDDDPGREPQPDEGPVTVTLPDGATTTIADPQLAAAMQAAADGTPVAEAFRRQGIDIPPPGTPVTAPVEQARVRPGDIGVFSDRHALAVGDGKALLDGQIHLVSNLRGPGFLGWQHPPVRIQEPAPAGEPVPTRPAMVLRA